MRITIDRGYCDTNLEFCQRCSAALIRNPEGYDRHCITNIVDDNSDRLTLVMHTDNRVLEIELDDEMRDLASVEGWEVLANFNPALFRTGALEHWRTLRQLPHTHA